MATKAVQLKKRLIKEVAAIIVLLALLAGGAYEVSDYDDDTLAQKQNQENENTQLRADNAAIQAQLSSGSEVSGFYEAYVKNHNKNFNLNREEVTQMLATLRERNHLINVSVTVSPITETVGAPPLKSGKMVQSEIKLTFNALTDNSVYGFVEGIERQLPGIVVIHSLSISKIGEISADILRDLSKHKLTPLIAGEVSFTWVGIRSTEDTSDAANKGQPHAP